MDPARAFIGDLVGILLFGLLGAMMARRRYRLCWSFFAYVAAVSIADRLTRGWPATFDTYAWWTMKESIFGWMKVVVVCEIGLLTFARLRRAQRILWGVLLTFVGIGMIVQLLPSSLEVTPWVSLTSLARGQTAILCLLAVVVGFAARYQVPVHPFHRGILIGFLLYLLAYSSAIALARTVGAFPAYRLFLAMDPTAYAATVGLWLWVSLRHDPVPTPAARTLHPWAYPA
jgi:hypothetical protein